MEKFLIKVAQEVDTPKEIGDKWLYEISELYGISK